MTVLRNPVAGIGRARREHGDQTDQRTDHPERRAVLADRVEQALAVLVALDEVAAMDGSAEERLSALLRRHIDVLTSSPFSGVFLADISELSSSQRAEYVSLRDRFEEGVRALISEGIEAGQFRAQDVSLAGFTILGAINWIPKWYDADGQLSAAAVAAGMADMLVRGLR